MKILLVLLLVANCHYSKEKCKKAGDEVTTPGNVCCKGLIVREVTKGISRHYECGKCTKANRSEAHEVNCCDGLFHDNSKCLECLPKGPCSYYITRQQCCNGLLCLAHPGKYYKMEGSCTECLKPGELCYPEYNVKRKNRGCCDVFNHRCVSQRHGQHRCLVCSGTGYRCQNDDECCLENCGYRTAERKECLPFRKSDNHQKAGRANSKISLMVNL